MNLNINVLDQLLQHLKNSIATLPTTLGSPAVGPELAAAHAGLAIGLVRRHSGSPHGRPRVPPPARRSPMSRSSSGRPREKPRHAYTRTMREIGINIDGAGKQLDTDERRLGSQVCKLIGSVDVNLVNIRMR